MEEKDWKLLGMALVAALWLALTVVAWCRPPAEFSWRERRQLAQFPTVSKEKLLDGTFGADFEKYTLDQFPLRDGFRQLKARVHYDLLCQRDNNGIYLAGGQVAKLEYPMDTASLDNALAKFQRIYDRYLTGCKVYAAIVPDKGYYLAEANGYPAMDYGTFLEKMEQGMPYARYVNLTDLLRGEDYYRTDTHWRQERLLPVANRLCAAMGTAAPVGLTAVERDAPFYGVYYGQAALPMKPDTLYTMEGPWLENCRVFNYETGKYGPVYDESKLRGADLYETFLSGSVSLLRVENPAGEPGRRLIVFRDSFGSSLVPLLAMGYESVTVVDIRYISSAMLDRFIQFNDQDVLFLYSTLVLNNSATFQ